MRRIQCGNDGCENIIEERLGMRVSLWGALMCPSCVKQITFPWVHEQLNRIEKMYRAFRDK